MKLRPDQTTVVACLAANLAQAQNAYWSYLSDVAKSMGLDPMTHAYDDKTASFVRVQQSKAKKK